MQPGNFNYALHLGQVVTARWSDRQELVVMEQNVELIRKTCEDWVVISPVAISEQTQVYLTGKNYTGNGIVHSCRKDDSVYILNIVMIADDSFYPLRHEFDPGMLNIDSFLTEEEESKILEGLNDEIPYSGVVHRLSLHTMRYILAAIQSALLPIRRRALVFCPGVIRA